MSTSTIARIRCGSERYNVVLNASNDSVLLMQDDTLLMTITCAWRLLLADGAQWGTFHVKHTENGYIWQFHKYDGTIQTYGASLERAEVETFKLYISSHEYKEKAKQAAANCSGTTG